MPSHPMPPLGETPATPPSVFGPEDASSHPRSLAVMPLVVPKWSELPWLWHGFSTRQGGVSSSFTATEKPNDLNLGTTPADSLENVRENRSRFLQAVAGRRDLPLITVHQVHSNRIATLRDLPSWQSSPAPEADGIVTGQPALLIGIVTADCVPVLVVDPILRIVGAFHAGWRGTAAQIVELGIAHMRAEFGSEPKTLLAAIGPAIGACCYSVGDEVRQHFADEFPYHEELFSNDSARSEIEHPANRTYLNLNEANRRQLLDAGLPAQSIAQIGGCTACHPDLFDSHRASGGKAGRMMAVIGIRPGA